MSDPSGIARAAGSAVVRLVLGILGLIFGISILAGAMRSLTGLMAWIGFDAALEQHLPPILLGVVIVAVGIGFAISGGRGLLRAARRGSVVAREQFQRNQPQIEARLGAIRTEAERRGVDAARQMQAATQARLDRTPEEARAAVAAVSPNMRRQAQLAAISQNAPAGGQAAGSVPNPAQGQPSGAPQLTQPPAQAQPQSRGVQRTSHQPPPRVTQSPARTELERAVQHDIAVERAPRRTGSVLSRSSLTTTALRSTSLTTNSLFRHRSLHS